MNVCKRFSIIFVALGLFLSVIAITSIPVLATEIDAEGTLVEIKGVAPLPDTVKPGMSSSQLSNEQRQAIIDKALDFYFPALTGYSKTCAQATLSAALKLYEEKKGGDINGLQYYLKSVALSIRSLVATSGSQSYMQWRSAGDVLLQLNSKLADTGIVDGVIDWDSFASDTALTAVRKFIDPSSGEEKTEERRANSSDVSVTSDVFKDFVNQSNTQYTPKNAIGKMSYRTDKRWHDNYDKLGIEYNLLSLYSSSNYTNGFTATNGGNDMYFIFFYTDGSDNYYSQYQYHLVVNPLDPIYDSSGENISSWGTTLDLYYWDNLDGSEANSYHSNLFKCCSWSNFTLEVASNNYLKFYPSNSFSDYVKLTLDSNNLSSIGFDSPVNTLYKSDMSTSIKYDYYLYSHFKGSLSSLDSSCGHNGTCDIGYIASTSPIQFTYLMDTSKIPDNYYVTITGDTIYDYSITNPETGQSDTINNYITNNYTYVTNNNGGGSSGGSGGTGGNVTVDGKIDVDGTVSVDVNVNVNGGAGGTSFGDVNTDPMNDYLNSALDESSGFRAFLGDFFSFLPVELLVLLGIGFTFVIIGRIMGR